MKKWKEKRKKEAFLKAYTEVAESTHSQFKDKHWKLITLKEEIHSTDANFFNIYDEFVKHNGDVAGTLNDKNAMKNMGGSFNIEELRKAMKEQMSN